MKNFSPYAPAGLKSFVSRLGLFVSGVTFLVSVSEFGIPLAAQERASPAEPIKANPVRPIQRSTVVYKPRTKQPATSSPARIDWTTLPSTYTHTPDGHRVDQFVAVTPEPIVEVPQYAKSGYRHTRSTLQAGFSSDNYHSVEQWGAPVRPYGEWRYPNRPFSVPYGVWGPQLPQVFGGGLGFVPGPFPIGPQPIPPGNNNGLPPGGMQPAMPWGGQLFGVGPQNALAPTQDDYYPQAPMLEGPQYHPLRNGLQ